MMEEVDLADTPLALHPRLNSQDSHNDEDPPDPRIQIELERLNTSTDLINKLEVDLDEARMIFRQTLSESTQNIDILTKKLGKCIDNARPYYDARIKAKQSLSEAQKSAVRYERAVSQHTAAREMVQLAEEGLLTRGCIFDSTWQEMLNHATTKVNDAEKEKIESTAEHREKSNAYHDNENRVKYLQKELKRAIAKSSLNARRSLLLLSNLIRMQELQLLPYFELKAAVNQRLEEQKRQVKELESAVVSAKSNYAQALSNLETISEQIHKTRQKQIDLGIRGIGVGAESPGPPFGAHFSELRIDSTLVNSSAIKNPQESTSPNKTPLDSTSPNKTPLDSTSPNKTPHDSTSPIKYRQDSTSPIKTPQNASASPINKPQDAISPNKKSTDSESLSHKKINLEYSDCSTNKKSEDIESQTLSLQEEKNKDKNFDSVAPSELTGWQFVAIPANSNGSQLLTVDDKESIVSDSESLASIEMLSDETIANLMLEDEINEASQLICSPPLDEFLAPPKPTTTTWEVVPNEKRPCTLPVSPSYCSSNSTGPSSPETNAYALLCDTPDPHVVDI